MSGVASLWAFKEDFTVVQTPQGLRVYFILYNAGEAIPETALYSVINTSIKWKPCFRKGQDFDVLRGRTMASATTSITVLTSVPSLYSRLSSVS